MEFRDLKDSQVSILVEINGKMHLVGMDKERLDAIQMIIKKAVDVVIPTKKTQAELNKFLGYNK